MQYIKPKLNIRADGNSEIGLGHIVRCISLAHMLKEDFKISFFCLSIPASIKQEIEKEGWTVYPLTSVKEFEEYLSGSEVAILDGYQFDSEYQKRMKEKAGKLVYIDDFHNQYMYADLVINHAPGVSKEQYEGEPYTKYLLGADYALLRPEFLNNERTSTKEINEIKRLFICFGGADFKNLTTKVIEWLPQNGYEVIVVTGNAYKYHEELNKIISRRNDLSVEIKSSLSAGEMAKEMSKADIGIVPSSGILFEATAKKLPVISGYYTENQISIYKGFLSRKVFIDVKDFSEEIFRRSFDKLRVDLLKSICDNQKAVIDGKSPSRLKKEFLEI